MRSRPVFLRLLGLVYLVAFLSLAVQVRGLVGERGILPVARVIERVDGLSPAQFPTFCWLNASDASLLGQCGLGVLGALLLLLGRWPRAVLLALWALYLSLSTAGLEFLSFQWDNLLIETGFLAVFLAFPGPPSRVFRWLAWWLLFRLYFQSGCVKLLSGDPSWRDLTAMSYHHWTQPLPTWIGWWMAQAPSWVHRLSTAATFVVELGVPFLIFAGRRCRLLAFAVFTLFQVLIALSGNYTFFNLLTAALGVLLLEDGRGERLVPGPLMIRLAGWALAGFLFWVGAAQTLEMFPVTQGAGHWALRSFSRVRPWRTVNRYGLFAVMTKERPEIEVEGSDDGAHWEPYVFRYKMAPGRRPAFVAPHQPRLDWQMWFAALGEFPQDEWILLFAQRLLEGSAPVLALLERNSFPAHPPRYVRMMRYDYRPATPEALRKRGVWWEREERGPYMPVVTLDPDGALVPHLVQ